MGESLSGYPLGEIISRMIKMLSADPVFGTADSATIEAEAIRRAKEALEKRSATKRAAENASRVRRAKEWADRVKSGDPKTNQDARNDAARSKYPDITVAKANEQITQIEQVADTSVPTWLATSIHENPQAAVCIARITELPPDLRDNPNVLYAELAKLNKSVKWSEATPEARKEARVVQDKILTRISEVAHNDATFGDASRDNLLEIIDPERVHLKTITNIRSAGAEPDETDRPAHDAWEERKIEETQKRNLQHTTEFFQGILDLPVNQTPEYQKEQLEQLIKDLRSGSTRGQRMNDVKGQHLGFNPEEVMPYINSIQMKIRNLDAHISQQQEQRRDEQYGNKKITMGELRKSEWFHGDRISHSAHSLSDTKEFIFNRNWTDRDVEFLRKYGYDKWFYKYADEVFGLGLERVQPSLAQQYKYEEFKDFINEVYGNEAPSIITKYQKHWEQRSKLDYIIHSMGLGAGDMKHRLEAMSLFQSDDIDYLNTFEHSELAFSFMERETFSLLADRLVVYERDKKWLAESINNGFHIADKAAAHARVVQAYKDLEKRDPKQFKKLVKLYQARKIQRDEYMFVLDVEHAIQSASDFAPHQGLHQEIQLKRDTVARGVVLEDMDVWGFADIEIDLVQTEEKLAKLYKLRETGQLSPNELQSFDADVEYLRKRKNELFQKKVRLEDIKPELAAPENSPEFIEYLTQLKGLSLLESNVYHRMYEYLKMKNPTKEPNVTDIRMAIWSARIHTMATGRMAAIGALMARMPGGDAAYHKTAGAKDIMRAPAFEDFVRIFNPEMFAARFDMGGKMGEVMRSYFRYNLRESRMAEGELKGKHSYFDSQEWKDLKQEMKGERGDKKAEVTMKLMEFAEKDLGIKFTELLAPGFMATGGQYDGTTWRMDLGIVDKIKAHYLDLQRSRALPDKAILDNQALAIRYLIAKYPEDRRIVLERMARRTPTKFFHLLADKRVDLLRQADIDPATWFLFENSLKYAETDLWKNSIYATRDINLASQNDFNEIVKPYLKTLLEGQHLPALDTDIEKYRKLLELMNTRLYATVHGRPYESIIDGLAREKLPLTLSLDDFDWKDAEMKKLGTLAFPRRTRDIGNMEQARNIFLAFMTNPEELLFPKDSHETIKKLNELKVAISNYAGTGKAEEVVMHLSKIFIEANRDRTLWSLPEFLPGGKAVGLLLSNMDVRPYAPHRGKLAKWFLKGVGKAGEATVGNMAKLSHKVKPVENFLNWMMPGWRDFSQKPFEEWPHSIGEAISWSTGFAHRNHWDERQLNEVLHEMQTIGLFTEHPNFVHDLRGKFKAGFLMNNVWAAFRRYWWVIPAATIAYALLAESEEEKKRSH